MKTVIALCLALAALMLMSFQPGAKIVRLKDGNYFAEKLTRISEADAQKLAEMSAKSKSETSVVHTSVVRRVVQTTITFHKEKKALELNENDLRAVNGIMAKYVQ